MWVLHIFYIGLDFNFFTVTKMKFGLRIPSLKKRLSARLSLKRYVRHSLGFKVPRGFGVVTNPKKAMYNKIYNKTSFSIERIPRLVKRTSNKTNWWRNLFSL